jgi:phage-related minor tail protein
MGGRSYVVGERGPELFTPGRTGSIAPNSAIGGDTSVVVNVDASGTEVQGNQGNADQLGRLIGQAVQAELIKQKRPGGLLTR